MCSKTWCDLYCAKIWEPNAAYLQRLTTMDPSINQSMAVGWPCRACPAGYLSCWADRRRRRQQHWPSDWISMCPWHLGGETKANPAKEVGGARGWLTDQTPFHRQALFRYNWIEVEQERLKGKLEYLHSRPIHTIQTSSQLSIKPAADRSSCVRARFMPVKTPPL